MFQKFFPISALLLVFITTQGVWTQKKSKKSTAATKEAAHEKEELARVSILRFADATGSKDFEYMPSSLTDAIDSSLQKKFLYNRENPEKSDKKAAEIRKLRKKFGAQEAEEFCKATGSDILVFGSFSFDQATSELVIETTISLGSVDKFRVLPPVRNKVDNTIFQAVEIVADSIVKEMVKIAQEQQERAGKEVAEKKEGEKVKIQKTDKSIHWADYKYMVPGSIGMTIPFLSTENAKVEPGPLVTLGFTRNFWQMFQLGIQASLTSIKTRSTDITSNVVTQLSPNDVVFLAGYFKDLSARWRLTTHLGAGYYAGRFEVYTECDTGCSLSGLEAKRNVQNPLYLAKAGIHYLLFSFLSIGATAEFRSYYDKPYPVNAFSAGLVVSGVF